MEKLVVFDLDFTLWNAGGTWCDHTQPPYKLVNNHVEDSRGRNIRLYPDVRALLIDLNQRNIQMACASRTSTPSWARQLLGLFDIYKYFRFEEIYPGSKIEHFRQLKKASGLPYNRMIFFDDEIDNIFEVGELGVKTVHVLDGVNASIVEKALKAV